MVDFSYRVTYKVTFIHRLNGSLWTLNNVDLSLSLSLSLCLVIHIIRYSPLLLKPHTQIPLCKREYLKERSVWKF